MDKPKPATGAKPRRRKPVPKRPTVASTLQELREIWGECQRCEMHKGRQQVVFGAGAAGGIMAIGQAPGKDEDVSGTPFQGVGGAFTKYALDMAKVPWDEVFFDNCMGCVCYKPKKEYLDPCRARLQDTILLVRPRLIVGLGAIAAKWLTETNKTMEALACTRGAYAAPGADWVVPTLLLTHPAEPARLDAPDAYARSMRKIAKEALALGQYARELGILPEEDE